jgi:hypothetical protein
MDTGLVGPVVLVQRFYDEAGRVMVRPDAFASATAKRIG